ncbi:MAG: isochorismatase [Rhodobacteraceae bacterium CG17_big_fil_post_rev_8_21_14_2_50_63_15]|nr:isochorismatase family protein [Roseovarius sp.]PIV78275.1 MAG: isochorismatase [Rhodobacteraceae bacterium CG17_big_fil_post_rev_8_21_14_2_50_63_15]
MLTIDLAQSHLLVIDFQTRLMAAIPDAPAVVQNARRLITAARRLHLPVSFTEQNPHGLGPTLPDLAPQAGEAVLGKMTFDALRTEPIARHLDDGRAVVVVGCEAHVCVLQTVLGLLDHDRRVHVVVDAIASRMAGNRDTALGRMERHGAELVTTEMVLFEWLDSADHPDFREILRLIK